MYEIFNTSNAVTVWRTRYEWIARLITYFNHNLDYALEGEGYYV